MKRVIEIGILLSSGGMYSSLSRASREGALQGVAEVNADPRLDMSFEVVERDPEGRLDRYAPLCREILRGSAARHILGCITSASRKEVIPELERFDGVLWYPVPYEGFEANEHVVYMHACPNQHLVPLLGYVVPRFGAKGLLLGSNYIWGWETNGGARDLIADAGGSAPPTSAARAIHRQSVRATAYSSFMDAAMRLVSGPSR